MSQTLQLIPAALSTEDRSSRYIGQTLALAARHMFDLLAVSDQPLSTDGPCAHKTPHRAKPKLKACSQVRHRM